MTNPLRISVIAAAFAATMLATESYAGGSLLTFVAAETSADLKAMEGKRVLGKNRELLGNIGKVDERANTVELKTPSGAIVSIPAERLIEDNGELSAPSLSRGDVLAMIDRPGEEPAIREVGATPNP
jgi:hypothetical protein